MNNSSLRPQSLQKSSRNPEFDHETIPLWRVLLLTHDHKKSFQPTFEECIELLEYDAELLADGAELTKIKPMINYHLALCSPFKEKLVDWSEKLAQLFEECLSHP
ncbi:hypothetical protein ACFLZW_04425 [Chloroflexota bacterium]